MIVAAPKSRGELGHRLQRIPIETHAPERWPRQRADEHYLATAGRAERAFQFAHLHYAQESMRPAGIIFGPCGAENRKQHHLAPALLEQIGDRKRQATCAADQRDRPLRLRRVHASVSASLRLTAIVNGRFPARMNAQMRETSGFPAYSVATASRRARNSPSPKNSR